MLRCSLAALAALMTLLPGVAVEAASAEAAEASTAGAECVQLIFGVAPYMRGAFTADATAASQDVLAPCIR